MMGPYELRRELGKGGMAQVWQAVRHYPGGRTKVCVLKFPRAHGVVDARAVDMFMRESQVALMLENEHIVRAWDVGVHGGVPFIVLDYVPSKNLAQLLRKRIERREEWPCHVAAHIAQQVGQGLVYAHELAPGGRTLGLVHRDVASKNVLISGSGNALLTDFGVAFAKVLHGHTDSITGTVAYMAPDHFAGRLGPWCDAFGLGAILWECVEGRLFRGDLDEAEAQQAAMDGWIPPLTREGVPSLIQRAIDGLLEPDYKRRVLVREALSWLSPFANGSIWLEHWIREVFGNDVLRTGHTSADIVLTPELERTYAAGLAAGTAYLVEEQWIAQHDPVSVDVERAGAPTAPLPVRGPAVTPSVDAREPVDDAVTAVPEEARDDDAPASPSAARTGAVRERAFAPAAPAVLEEPARPTAVVHPRAFVEAASETPVVAQEHSAEHDVGPQSAAIDPADRHATVRYGEITDAEPRTPTHRLPTNEEPSVGPTVQVESPIPLSFATAADRATVRSPAPSVELEPKQRMSRDAWNNPDPPYEGFFEGRPPPPDFFEFVELEDGTRLPWLTRPVRGRSPALSLALAIVVSALAITAAMILLGAFGCQVGQTSDARPPTDPAAVLQSDEARAKTMPERVSR